MSRLVQGQEHEARSGGVIEAETPAEGYQCRFEGSDEPCQGEGEDIEEGAEEVPRCRPVCAGDFG